MTSDSTDPIGRRRDDEQRQKGHVTLSGRGALSQVAVAEIGLAEKVKLRELASHIALRVRVLAASSDFPTVRLRPLRHTAVVM